MDVCVVNLCRLFSPLQTHANEMEWKWMTSIQAQTDSLISAFPTNGLCLFFSLTPCLLFSSVHTPDFIHTHTHTSIHVFFRPVSISKPFYRKRANVTNAAVLSPGGFTLTICLHKISFANHFHSSDICFCPLCLVIWEYLLMPHIQTNSEIALSLSHFDACL